jgi:hypothetical protein
MSRAAEDEAGYDDRDADGHFVTLVAFQRGAPRITLALCAV